MALSLYDVTVVSFLQTVGAAKGFLKKGAEFAQSNGIDLQDIVESRLRPDMWPFRLQVISIAHHSRDAIQGVQGGVFAPPSGGDDLDYAGLQKLVADAHDFLGGLTPASINALEGKDVVFKLGPNGLPFTAEGLLLSLSLPNLHFHATTAYDILRIKGAPLGKLDYMGKMRMKG
ncbi:MAG: DUF1993 domain-containing protein [Gammaproteobacteria bacterium]|nr:DUF1993 domain-containing protein [Gammaproteobacteria bacterium]